MTILVCNSILQTSAECLLCAGDCFLCALQSESVSRSVMSDSLQPHGLQPARLLCPWDSPSQKTGTDIYTLLMCVCLRSHFSHVQLCATLWTVAHQAPLSMGFSKQEYWSGLPCPPPGHLPNPGTELISSVAPTFQADSLPLSHQGRANILYLIV